MKAVVVAAFVGLWTSAGQAEDINPYVEQFLEKAQVVETELAKKEPSSTVVMANITAMLESSKPVLVAFGKKYTSCKKQLEALVAMFPKIENMNAQEIRSGIEKGELLPPGEGCYAARDIVAHPAIVRSLAKDGVQEEEKRRMVIELGEAIEHIEEIRDDLNQ